MRVGIVGGGVTGLVAGYYLSKRGADVLIFEAEPEVGGLLRSYCAERGGYCIERFYHHIFRGDRGLIELIEELGLSNLLDWRKGSTGYHVGGRVYPLTTPGEILRFPHLTLLDKARLAALVLRSRICSLEDLDGIRARDLIERTGGKRLYRNFFEPLLRSKFGEKRGEVSAAWLFGRIRIRSDRSPGGEHLGYMRGGFQRLVDALADQIIAHGGAIHTDEPVTRILIDNGRVSGLESRKERYRFDRVISTVPPGVLREISGIDLGSFPYQGACCALFGMKKALMEGVYWLNIADDLPFGALIEHTNLFPVEWYGEHLLYVASYFQSEKDPLWQKSEKEVIRTFISGIKRLFPGFSEDDIRWWRVARTRYAGPIYSVGLREQIPPYRVENIGGLYLAGMFSMPNYPERSINGSIIAGKACCEALSNDNIADGEGD